MEQKDILDLDFNAEEDNTITVQSVSVNKFIILSIFSFGLYEIWWMYKAWVFMKEKDRIQIMPVARAIFSIFFLNSLFERILQFARVNGYQKQYSSAGLYVIYIVFTICDRLPEPYSVIGIFTFLAFFQPVDAFNKGIELSPYYSLNIRSKFSLWEIIILIIGGILWLAIIILLYSGEDFSSY